MNNTQPTPLHQIDALVQAIADFLSTEAKSITVTGNIHLAAVKLKDYLNPTSLTTHWTI